MFATRETIVASKGRGAFFDYALREVNCIHLGVSHSTFDVFPVLDNNETFDDKIS